MKSDDAQVPQLPNGCGYVGQDFGASYQDSQCYGGRLYDLDNCDGNGNLYEPLEYIPCPKCRHWEWREQFASTVEMEGYTAAEDGKRESDCPYPKDGLRFPEDGKWLGKHWLNGFRSGKEALKA